MGNKVNIVRKDGSVISATPEQAEKLKLLGYREETPDEGLARAQEDAQRKFYTSTSQRVKAGI